MQLPSSTAHTDRGAATARRTPVLQAPVLQAIAHSSTTRWVVDALTTVAIFLVLMALSLKLGGYTSALGTLGGWMMVLAMVLRRNAPLLMMSLVTLGGLIVVMSSRAPTEAVLVAPLATYSVARWVPGHAARISLVAGACGSLLAAWRWGYVLYQGTSPLTGFVLVSALCFGLIVTPYAVGRRVLASAVLREQQHEATVEREHHSVAEQEQKMRIAEATARAQIARELHDIVAHSLSVIIVQAEGGKALATKRPEAAAQVLGTIAESGREALGEMRRIVAVLRDGPTAEPDYTPTPGLDDIPELVTRSGARVNLDIVGQVPRVPQTLGLTAYRIVQEALTNVLRHAGPDATAQVLMSYSPHLVVVEVIDNGQGSASSASSDGQGNGLRGMRERVASMGGQLVARPRSGGGFLVRALLPIVPQEPASSPTGTPDLHPRDRVGDKQQQAGAASVPGRGSWNLHPQSRADAVPRQSPDTTQTQYVPTPQMTQRIAPPPEPTRQLPDPDPTIGIDSARWNEPGRDARNHEAHTAPLSPWPETSHSWHDTRTPHPDSWRPDSWHPDGWHPDTDDTHTEGQR